MKYYLTCDIGGTDLKYGIINSNSEIVESSTSPTKANEGGLAIIGQIIDFHKEYSKKYKIEGIAISSAGIVNPFTTEVLDATNTIKDYIGINISEEINNEIKVNVSVENDVNCVALCEAKLGAGKGSKSMLAMTIGTGIGGAIVLDGNLVTGNGYSAGEWGNMYINGKVYEQIASTRALVNRTQLLDPSITNGIDVFKQVDQGNEIIKAEVDKYFDDLSVGIVNMMYAFNPEIIVLGGGVTARGDKFLQEVINHVRPKLSAYIFSKTKIVLAEFKNDAGMHGAFQHHIKQFNI